MSPRVSYFRFIALAALLSLLGTLSSLGQTPTFLRFPRVVNTATERTGFAIVNLSDSSANLAFRAFNEQGQLVSGFGVTNPVTRVLPAGGQLAKLAFELFGAGFATTSSWVEVESDNPHVVGFFLFFDDAINFLDGADVQSVAFPNTLLTQTASMELHLSNFGFNAASVSLSLNSEAGKTISSRTIEIPARGRFSSSVSSLFSTPGPEVLGDQQEQPASRSLFLSGTGSVAVFGLLGDRSRFIGGLNGQSADAGLSRLYAPQYVEDSNFTSEVSIVNTGPSAATVSLQLVGEDGNQLGTVAQRSIPSRGLILIDDPSIFGRPRGGGPTEGYLVIDSNGPPLVGWVVFGDPARTRFLAALPLVGSPQRDVIFSQVAQNDLFFTGASILNTSSDACSSNVEVYDSSGRLIKTATKTLPARGRDAFVLTELFPDLRVDAGYFRIRSNQDMASFAVFGTHHLSALSAIPQHSRPPAGNAVRGVSFGVQGGWPNFEDAVKATGVGFIRAWINWSDIEPVKDQYRWSSLDELVNKADQAGIKVLGYFRSTPAWAKKRPGCMSDICAITDMNEFKQCAKDVAARYRGKMDYIEILNEVTLEAFFERGVGNDYRDWLIAGYEGVKAGNRDATVLIGGLVNPLDAREFVDDMLQHYNRYYDVVNFHVYASEDKVSEASRYIKGRMQAFGVSKPVWITETATKIVDTSSDQQKLARDVIKRYARAFGEGIEKVCWWQLVDLPLPSEYSGAGTSTGATGLGWDYPKGYGQTPAFHPRQAYHTYKVMTSKLAGFDSVKKVDDTQYRFVVNGKAVYVLWGSGSLPAEITGTCKVTDYLGNETRLAGDIILSDSPVFIERYF